MKEYRTERVSPEEESSIIMHYEAFGWKLENTREIYHESERLVGANIRNTEYSGLQTAFNTETEVTNYVTLRFSRDMQMRNYLRLSALQDEFESLEEPQQKECPVKLHDKPKGWTILSCVAVLVVIAFIILTATVDDNLLFVMIIVAIVAIFSIVVMIIKWVGYKTYYYSDLKKILSHQRQYESMVELYEKRREKILDEAVRLSFTKK